MQADAVPIKLYDESGVEEDEESDDWWAEEGEEEGEDAEGRSSNDEDSSSSSSSSEDSSSSSDSSSESSSESDTEAEGEGEEEVRPEELPGTSHTTPLLKQRLAAGLAAAAGRQQLEGVDEATRRLLLESVLQGGDGERAADCRLGGLPTCGRRRGLTHAGSAGPAVSCLFGVPSSLFGSPAACMQTMTMTAPALSWRRACSTSWRRRRRSGARQL